MSRDSEFAKAAAALGYSFEGGIKIGGNYVPLVRDGNTSYISGQIPRVQDTVVVTGRAGSDVGGGEVRRIISLRRAYRREVKHYVESL